MSAMVRIPTPLRKMTNGLNKIEIESATLGLMVTELEAAYPGFKERLVDENGELRYFMNIYINGEEVRFFQGVDPATTTGPQFNNCPAVAGVSR